MLRYRKKDIEEEIIKIFGSAPTYGIHKNSRKAYDKYYSDIEKFCEDKLFSAELNEASVYASEGSATAYAGIYSNSYTPYKLPNHLEIREIKSSLVEPNDSSNCDDKCYFCGETAVRFHEHYYFCPECSAIYTYLIVQKPHCKHVKSRTPTVIREPWYKELRNSNKKPYIIEKANGNKVCSICNKPCDSDGW